MWRVFMLVMVLGATAQCAQAETFGKDAKLETILLDRNREFRITFSDENKVNPFRVEAWSEDATARFPVLVVVKQERRVTSWQIPLPVQTNFGTSLYPNTSRILCYDSQKVLDEQMKTSSKVRFLGQRAKRNFTVTLTTASPTQVRVFLRAGEFKRYFVDSNKNYAATFSPSEPVIYSYSFPPSVLADDDVQTVLVDVTSDDDICFTVSAQKKICPVYDLNDNIIYDGKYQTVSTKGGLTIAKHEFPDGFYLVFVSKGDNYDCNHASSLPNPNSKPVTENRQISTVTFRVQLGKTRNEYVGAILVVFFTLLGSCIVLVIVSVTFYYLGKHRTVAKYEDPIQRTYRLNRDVIDGYSSKTEPRVVDFVMKGEDNDKKALNYFWHICNIAIFYGIPVVQLMISYQRAVNFSGNLDICYHNFQCSHPLYFTDFNHIFSNIGYILFGLLFLAMTYFRNRKYHNQPHCGIPRLYGLYYSMGLALVFEGILSACYHVCPNQSNFQFDTSFMYVMAALIMVKLYQNRHPDVNASAYSTFAVLGFAVILAMFGILFNSMAIMVVFIVAYIAFCLYVALKIYFFGYVVNGWRKIYHQYKDGRREPAELCKPIRIGRFVTVTIANVINFLIAITGLVLYPKVVDFGTFLLAILLLNSVVYAVFYCVMKIISGERICVEAIFYGLLAAVAWGFGGYFFLNAATVWSSTPAESRQMNQRCILMGFYDTHDIWHLLSAPALYFSFMFLMALDDDLFDKPQVELRAF